MSHSTGANGVVLYGGLALVAGVARTLSQSVTGDVLGAATDLLALAVPLAAGYLVFGEPRWRLALAAHAAGIIQLLVTFGGHPGGALLGIFGGYLIAWLLVHLGRSLQLRA